MLTASPSYLFFKQHEEELSGILREFTEIEAAGIDFRAEKPQIYLQAPDITVSTVETIQENIQQLYKKYTAGFEGEISIVKTLPVHSLALSFYLATKVLAPSATLPPSVLTPPPEKTLSSQLSAVASVQNSSAPSEERIARLRLAHTCITKIVKANGPSQKIKEDLEKLTVLYQDKKKLPSKLEVGVEENKTYDLERLNYINEALNVITRYWKLEETKLIKFTEEEATWVSQLKRQRCKIVLQHIAFTLGNISDELQAKYRTLLKPSNFTWQTFAQLGAAIKISPSAWQPLLLKESISPEVARRLVKEYNSAELVIEAAIVDIVQDDIPKLVTLFKYIYACETQASVTLPDFTPVNLLAIHAFVRRIIETESLVKLLTYANSEYIEIDIQETLHVLNQPVNHDQGNMPIIRAENKPYVTHPFTLDTQLGRHAALHRLVLIGELISDKNFSALLQQLDSNIDWQDFVLFRDVLLHPEVADTKSKVEKLLIDNQQFLLIFRDQMHAFFNKLHQLVIHRDQILPRFDEAHLLTFWQAVYANEKNIQGKTIEIVKDAQMPARVSDQEWITFMQTLQDPAVVRHMKTLQDQGVLKDARSQWLGILNGQLDIPTKKNIGKLFSVFSPLNDSNKSLYKQCQVIKDKVINYQPVQSSSETPPALAEQKKGAKENILQGLQALRETAAASPANPPTLTRVEQVNAAIEAVENIKKFIESDELVQANFNFPTVGEWNKTQTHHTIQAFLARFVTSPEFNDAIAYNASQLLAYIAVIRTYPEAEKSQILMEKDLWRSLHHYLTPNHGLVDATDTDSEDKSLLDFQQTKIGPIMIVLIFDLLPVLRALQAEVS